MFATLIKKITSCFNGNTVLLFLKKYTDNVEQVMMFLLEDILLNLLASKHQNYKVPLQFSVPGTLRCNSHGFIGPHRGWRTFECVN